LQVISCSGKTGHKSVANQLILAHSTELGDIFDSGSTCCLHQEYREEKQDAKGFYDFHLVFPPIEKLLNDMDGIFSM